MAARIWEVLRLEDLLWTAVTSVVGASGAELLDAPAGRIFVGAAAIVFLGAGALSPPCDRRVRLLALGPAVIIPDAILQDQPVPVRVGFVLVAAGAVAFALIQDGRWLRLPRRARRVMTWPYLAAMGDLVGELLARGVDPTGDHPLLLGRTTGETVARIAITLGALLPVVYVAFVAAPRAVAADEREPVRRWAARYAFALAGAAAGVAVAALSPG